MNAGVFILFYYDMIMFKPLMPKEMYEHFLCLCVAIRLLADPTSNACSKELAQKLLQKFVSQFDSFYGTR